MSKNTITRAPNSSMYEIQVAEIYATAGKSFSRLAELTARLHKIQDPDNAAKAR